MSTLHEREHARTFKSGPYLDQLFSPGGRVDAYLEKMICERIKQARIEAGFTQTEIADLLSITPRGYQNYEDARVPWRKLEQIAKLTNVSQEWLLHGDEVHTPPTELLQGVAEAVAVLETAQETGLARLAEALELLKRIEGLLSRPEAADR